MPCGFAKKFHRVSRSGKERTESVNHRIFPRSIILIVRVLTQQIGGTGSMQMPGGAQRPSHLSRYPMQPMPICDSFQASKKEERRFAKGTGQSSECGGGQTGARDRVRNTRNLTCSLPFLFNFSPTHEDEAYGEDKSKVIIRGLPCWCRGGSSLSRRGRAV